MGSIISPPKAPAIVVAAPPPVSTADNAAEETAEETAARARRADLLNRERGILGTVQTGFRGILNLAANGPPRKTLLGE